MATALSSLNEKLENGNDLDVSEVQFIASELLNEGVDPGVKADLLAKLAEKGETATEIAAFVDAFLERAVKPNLDKASLNGLTIDVCGTGGDKLNLFNVSTSCIFVLAAAGLSVVKHGNRGITSKSGGADVLESLGVKIDLPPDQFVECLKSTGVGFLFAPHYHPAFKAVIPVRKELAERGVRTVFNILGPLLNPVKPDFQLVGVFSEELPPVFAEILAKLGRKRAWAVHGKTADGRAMDELSTMGPTIVASIQDQEAVEVTEILASDFGIEPPALEEVAGGDAAANAAILEGILDGTVQGPKRDLVLLNSAAGLVIAGKAPNLEVGIPLAAEMIDSKAALAKLDAMRNF
tara:strand:- start:16243 stop:17292 length:1050 start_codon:yes stop_codon:yes gene_type:complete